MFCYSVSLTMGRVDDVCEGPCGARDASNKSTFLLLCRGSKKYCKRTIDYQFDSIL